MRTHLLLICAVLAGPSLAARAQDAPARPAARPAGERIVVTVRGVATAPADEVDLQLVVTGEDEEARAAEKRHRERLAKVVAALEGKSVEREARKRKKKEKDEKKDEGEDGRPAASEDDAAAAATALPCAVREGATAVGVPTPGAEVYDDDGNPKPKETRFHVSTAVNVTIKGVAAATRAQLRLRLADLLERATNAGAESGGEVDRGARPSVRFRVNDPEQLRFKAYADALARGRARGEELAKLADRKARLVTISEVATGPSEGGVPSFGDGQTGHLAGFDAVLARLGETRADGLARSGTSTGTEVPAEVTLQLEFELR